MTNSIKDRLDRMYFLNEEICMKQEEIRFAIEWNKRKQITDKELIKLDRKLSKEIKEHLREWNEIKVILLI